MLLEDVLCRFPYDLFACAGRGAPFAFGGWLLGRAVVLSDEMVDVDIDMVD